MTDRELLELAAKAAGLQWDAPKQQWWDGSRCLWHDWNPLDDDGDALRLAVKLRITVSTGGGPRSPFRYCSRCWGFGVPMGTESHGTDASKATRRAIVRAAAAIGEKQ